MQYLLLIYDDEKRWANMSEGDMQKGMAAYNAFGEEFAGKALSKWGQVYF